MLSGETKTNKICTFRDAFATKKHTRTKTKIYDHTETKMLFIPLNFAFCRLPFEKLEIFIQQLMKINYIGKIVIHYT
jgi:hypothetical protein